MSTIPITKFVNRCEKCLHFECKHQVLESGAVYCESCGCCYSPSEEAIFLTKEQFLEKYPESILADDIRRSRNGW